VSLIFCSSRGIAQPRQLSPRRCDPNGLEHASFVDEYGVFHYVHVDAACGAITSLARFQLFFNETPDDPSAARPSERTWHSFEFVHKLPGDIIFFQQRSNRILYTSMPISTSEPSAVCLFGAHTASISVMKHNNSVLLSGSEDGSAKMWRLSDGQLLDTLVEPYTCSITAIEFVGPLLVSHMLLPTSHIHSAVWSCCCTAAPCFCLAQLAHTSYNLKAIGYQQ
jgi:hypothetical protein